MAGEQPPQSFGVDPSPIQRGVEAAPAATMRCLEAQVNGRRDGGVRSEDGVGELEESVAPAVEAFVERVAEAVESIGRFHDAPIMHSPRAFCTPYLPVELKRKLRCTVATRLTKTTRNHKKYATWHMRNVTKYATWRMYQCCLFPYPTFALEKEGDLNGKGFYRGTYQNEVLHGSDKGPKYPASPKNRSSSASFKRY